MKNTNKLIAIKLLDQTGHTDLALAIEEAIERIVAEKFEHNRWVMLGGTHFQFSAASNTDAKALLADTIKLRTLLEENDEVIVTLTDDLQGGGR